MADFSALKTSIQNYIKQNGNEEITGNLLQQILLSMVTSLGDSAINDLVTALNNEVSARQNADGTLQTNINNEATARGNADTQLGNRIISEAETREESDNTLRGLIDGIIEDIENGYVYAGIATPSSTPASGKVFYLALTAGTYTNFGATVVPQGINILKYNGSVWSLDSFLGLDDAPTQGSYNLVKSGGVFNDTHITTDYTENIEKSAFIVKSFGNYQEGDIAEFAGCALSYPIKVHKGDKVKYNLGIGDSGWPCALYSGKETDYTTFITHLDNGDEIPVDGYIRFGYQSELTPSPLFEIYAPVNSSIEILQKEFENTSIITENLTNEATEVGFICYSFGSYQEGDFVPFNGCLCSNPIRVYAGDVVNYILGMGDSGLPCALYSNKEADHTTFISSIANNGVIAQNGYIRFSYQVEVTPNPSFEIKRSLDNMFNEVINQEKEDVSTLSKRNIVDIYLPKKLYVAVGVNCCLYPYHIANILEDDAVNIWINGEGLNYKKVWKYNPQNEEINKNIEVICYGDNLNHVQDNNNSCTLVTVPNTGLSGTKNVLICGSSCIQKGLAVPYFYNLFEDASINLIGRYGFDADKHREGQGSMPITGYLESQGVCYLCQVTGLTEEATVGYVTNGTTYRDTNNVEFQCRENRATNGNGYMVLWGEQSPAVGTLTKVNGPGSSEVTIVSVEEIDKNPFYNRQESKVDFNWYLTKYGFNTPDVIIVDEWANTARANMPTTQFTNLYKQFVDIIHTQLPNCIIIIDLLCCGIPSPYGNSYEDNVRARKYWHPMRELFEGNTYKDFVYIHNQQAWIDPVRSYGSTNVVINQVTGETESVLDDNIHYNNVGAQLVANSWYSAVRGLLLGL